MLGRKTYDLIHTIILYFSCDLETGILSWNVQVITCIGSRIWAWRMAADSVAVLECWIYSARHLMHWNGRSACWISKAFEIKERSVFQTMTICLSACTLTGWYYCAARPCLLLISVWVETLQSGFQCSCLSLNRLSVGRAWNPFVHEYWQFLTVYALFRIGLYRYFQRFVWVCHYTEKDCCLLFAEWINHHHRLLLLLIIFVPLIPETLSLGYTGRSA
jgi:hypothetical protein